MNSVDRAQLVDSVKFYAVRLAASFYKKPHPMFDFEDVVQAAMLGAVEASTKYDPQHESHANFMTFAAHPMKNRVITLYRTATPAHIPRREYDLMPQSERGRHIWSSHVPLSTPVFRSMDSASEVTLESMLPDADQDSAYDITEIDARVSQVRELVALLPTEERKIVSAVFGLNGFSEVRLSDIASYRGVTRQRVHQQLTSALKKLERMALGRGLAHT